MQGLSFRTVFLTLFFLIHPAHMLATPRPFDPQSREAALKLCQAMPSSQSSTCLTLAMQNSFELRALNFCQTMNTYTKVLSCMEKTANAEFQPRTFDICASMNTYDRSLKCLDIFKNRQFQDRALDLCQRMNTYDMMLDCFDSVANKKFIDAEISACSGMRTYQAQLECLRLGAKTPDSSKLGSSGRDLEDYPKVGRGRWYGRVPCISHAELHERLSTAIRDLRQGQSRQAQSLLENLRDDLDHC